MSQAASSSSPYRNSGLFSGYYLEDRIDDLDEWECDEEAEAAFAELNDLWESEGDLLPSYKEDELLGSWIDEILDVLGYATLQETTLPGGDGYNDRLLFESTETRREASRRKQEGNVEAMYGLSSAILEAKQYDADFDRKFDEQRSYHDASHQIRYYLDRAGGEVDWGILTNGKEWRLYGTKDYATEIYYEVDLVELLETGNVEEFKYFYAFFRPDAFRETAGTNFLDTVWNESETAAQELGEDLQDNVFTALRILGEGFVETNDLEIGSDDDADISADELKEQSLVLLYRLMFVLYAESRGLMQPDDPEAEAEYEENFSLDQLRLEIDDRISSGDSYEDYSSYSTTIWSQLQNLFSLVDTGNDDLGVPPYNGGLFDAEEHEFLAENEVSDPYIAEVIHRLGTTKNDDGELVLADYADLDTRHLGTIYEGLLEHEFRIAPEQYAAVAKDGGQVWKPATEVSVADAVESVDEGSLYVVNDDGERKATGAYYTPDYVVSYIVEETIDPLLDEIKAELEADGLEPSDQAYFGRFYGQLQNLKILDPAMGSAHFLTSATGYLTEQVMEIVREQELQGRNEQELRRTIAKECIYGVDINGMAVELGKLSMWLETLAADKPLAFLDHHIKTGNSLIGSDITEVLSEDNGDNGGQLTLTQSFARARQQTLEHVMDLMEDLLAIDNDQLSDIKSMEELYDEIRDDPLYQRLFEIANVHTAEQFGLDVPEDVYKEMAGAIDDGDEWEEIQSRDWFASAQATADDQSFFHWELEYPEVFFGEDGEIRADAGFDAVVGNPPYVNISNMPTGTKSYLSKRYNEIYAGNSDIMYYFLEQSLNVSRKGGSFGLIVSRYFIHAQYASGLREFLLENGKLTKIVDFENYQAFPGVDVLADILFCENNSDIDEYNIDILKLRDDRVSNEVVANSLLSEDTTVFSKVEMSVSNLSSEPWNLIDEATLKIKNKMEKTGWKLGNNYNIVQSMQTGHNESLVVSEEDIEEYNLEEELLKPLAKTKNIRRYLIRNIKSYVLWTEVDDISQYPNIKEYLENYKEDLADRYDIKSRGADWWKISNPRNQDLFASQEARILTPFMSTSNKFAIDTDQHFNDGGDIRAIFEEDSPVDLHYTLALLNTTLGEFYHKNTAKLKRDGYYEYYGNAMQKFPVFDINKDKQLSELDIDQFSHDAESSVYNVLCECAEEMREYKQSHHSLNLDLLDYLGNYSEGQSLSEIGFTQPPAGSANSILQAKTEKYPNLRVGTGSVVRESSSTVEVELTARYKPEELDKDVSGPVDHREADQWGYVETDPETALRITDLTEIEADLIEAFVPVAIDEAGGFAGFRETATKTNSLVDRLHKLTLPAVSDVETGLKSYMQTKKRAEELEAKIEQTDELIDEIVYELYGLTDEEIDIVEEAVKDD